MLKGILPYNMSTTGYIKHSNILTSYKENYNRPTKRTIMGLQREL